MVLVEWRSGKILCFNYRIELGLHLINEYTHISTHIQKPDNCVNEDINLVSHLGDMKRRMGIIYNFRAGGCNLC